MELKIVHCNNFYKIKGSLNKKHVIVFEEEFKNVFSHSDTVVISIEDISHIDKDGVQALTNLYKEAVAKHKKLSIVGLGCEDLYDHFASIDVA
ncbi:MAG: STAS domain-containing protein [Flavobacteriaceae bacterium]